MKRSGEQRHCSQCDAEYWVRKSRLLTGRGQFCSRICYEAWIKARGEARTNKKCSGCREDKPLDDFHFHISGTGSRQSICKACAKKRGEIWREQNPGYNTMLARGEPGYNKRLRLRSRYGLTQERYLSMIEAQKNLCAICGQPERRSIRGEPAPLCIDHDHTTGRVRGLLCHACNIALVYVEREDWWEAAQQYLRENSDA